VELQAQITPQAMVAMVGGLMGACLIALPKAKHDGVPVSLVLIFFGVSTAVVASDFMLINLGYDRLGAHTALGTGVGSVGGSMMMAIRAISPSFAEKLVDIGAKSVIGFVSSKDRMKRALAAFFSK
jgi:drug/metabolite transporter (DMT)-like permease